MDREEDIYVLDVPCIRYLTHSQQFGFCRWQTPEDRYAPLER